MKLSDIAMATHGKLIGEDCHFYGICTDSRLIQRGELFIALVGEKFDGHKYISSVAELGACAVVVDHVVESDVPQILVSDTLIALGLIGSCFAVSSDAELVALTGSCGKTTTKEMIRLSLSRFGSVHATQGNFNNHIGVPLTLGALKKENLYGVIEMGASGLDEIKYTVSLIKPKVVLITNASQAHLEGFGSFENIVQAKGEIIRFSSPDSCVVLNKDDASYQAWHNMLDGRKEVTFSARPDSQSDVYLVRKESLSGIGYLLVVNVDSIQVEFELHAAGDHMIQNALAALAVAYALKVDVSVAAKGLSSFHPVKGRLSPINVNGFTVWDDSYNANPRSVEAAIQAVGEQKGEKWLVLGALAELGDSAESAHAEIGACALKNNFDRVFAIGPLAERVVEHDGLFGTAYKKTDMDVLISDLQNDIKDGLHILVKGSRSAGMEKVIEALQSDFDQQKNNIIK